MRRLFSMLLASALVLTLHATATLAQNELTPAPLMSRLDLTAEQQVYGWQAIRDTLNRYAAVKDGVESGRTADPAEIDRKLAVERQRANSEMGGFLNEAQTVEWGRILDEIEADIRSAAPP